MTTLLVIAKEPRPGRVKTRLTPPFTPREAAELAEAALADTLHTVARTPASRRVLVLDGTPGAWLPPGFEVVPQCAGGLDERLADAFAHCAGPALLIGMDTPQVTPELLTVDFADCDAWLGPARDGGFWALGLAEPDPALLRGVPMSTPGTGAAQRARLTAAGLRVREL
ncbi:TIGR04282 family arsenosugar biosynthesis glycosyltransferase, partial [Streptomyces sp. CAS3]